MRIEEKEGERKRKWFGGEGEKLRGSMEGENSSPVSASECLEF